ncbi:hormogonium polysaccharide biosynthesis acetyltransferase HpsU [Leptolyngbya iicbica]|uniref:Colanic acid biosynthesis acetyltransferase WcaF n=2 Tax=Cyanophyceae TaxID=3028117 RepID=A0A4Q7EHD8_9CYAN|nr:hormogonium polysaccharide biosynthesis acetyltransferase HpsU [Leptolyngbya sp. LK]RZM82516.1 colanic acid biosynthesis acetyltransferase WcaF [Leptolyngbya sp. LK]
MPESSRPQPLNAISAEPNASAWVDLRQYDQSWYSPGQPKWLVLLWWLVQAVVFPLTLHAHHAPRRTLLRWFGAQVGQGVVIRPSARFHYPWKVTIGDYSWIGSGVEFYSLGEIHIGSHCVVSQNSYLCTGSHDPSDRAFGLQVAPITVEDGAWIAAGCFVGPGVTIGANSIVGARSNVFGDLPPGQICLGSPCRPVKPRMMN